VNRIVVLQLVAMAVAAAQTPRIAVIGGPQPLWPQVLAEFERRFPAAQADCSESRKSQTGQQRSCREHGRKRKGCEKRLLRY
jgi:hypothetical protein